MHSVVSEQCRNVTDMLLYDIAIMKANMHSN